MGHHNIWTQLYVTSVVWCFFSTRIISGTNCTGRGTICSACGTDIDKLELSCGEDEVITGFIEGGYRAGADRECVYKEGDCLGLPREHIAEFLTCSWHKSNAAIKLKLQMIPFMLQAKNCNNDLRLSYVQIREYRCLPQADIHSICKSDSVPLQAQENVEKQIITPGFMAAYALDREFNSSLCSVRISSESPNHGIMLKNLYMDLAPDDIIRITDDQDRNLNYHGKETELLLHSEWITLKFMTQRSDTYKKGFALLYTSYVVDPNVTEIVPETPTTTVAAPTTNTAEPTPVVITYPRPRAKTAEHIPSMPVYLITIIVVISLLFLVSVISALAVVLIRAWRNSGTVHQEKDAAIIYSMQSYSNDVQNWVDRSETPSEADTIGYGSV